MRFRIRASEHVGDEVRRVVFELIDHANSVLTPQIAEAAPQRVHEARKSFKKVRAVIRLVRTDLGVDLYRAENRWFRDAGRQLAHLRDADAMLEAINRLRKQVDPDHRSGLEALEEAAEFFIDRRETAQTVDGVSLTERVRLLAEDLAVARRRVAAWPLWSNGFKAIGGGFQRTYARARRAFLQVCREYPTSDRVHEWRKRTKYHWYHIRLLDEIGEELLTPYRTALDGLSQLLGEHQDLAVLGRTIARPQEADAAGGSAATLLDLVRKRQSDIRDQARIDGERIFAERPGALRRRMEVYWQAWLVEHGQASWAAPVRPAPSEPISESDTPLDQVRDDGEGPADDGDGGAVAESPTTPPPPSGEMQGDAHDSGISVAQLASLLGVTRRMVYQWVKRQWIAPLGEKPYRFSVVDVERLRGKLEDQQMTRDLCEQVMHRRGVSYDAARAWVARRRRLGMTDAEIVRELPPRQPSMTRKAQRFAETGRGSREPLAG